MTKSQTHMKTNQLKERSSKIKAENYKRSPPTYSSGTACLGIDCRTVADSWRMSWRALTGAFAERHLSRQKAIIQLARQRLQLRDLPMDIDCSSTGINTANMSLYLNSRLQRVTHLLLCYWPTTTVLRNTGCSWDCHMGILLQSAYHCLSLVLLF